MTNMQELIKGKLAPGRGRETDNGVTGLCASSGRILNSRIQSGNRLQAQAPPSAHGPADHGALPAAVRQSRSLRCGARGALRFGESPQGTRAQPPVSEESLLVSEALS